MALTFLQRLQLEHGNMAFTPASVAALGTEFGLDATQLLAALTAAITSTTSIRTIERRGVWSCVHNHDFV